MTENNFDWHDIVNNVDPVLGKNFLELSEHIIEQESEIPKKYKELILMACLATSCNNKNHSPFLLLLVSTLTIVVNLSFSGFPGSRVLMWGPWPGRITERLPTGERGGAEHVDGEVALHAAPCVEELRVDEGAVGSIDIVAGDALQQAKRAGTADLKFAK